MGKQNTSNNTAILALASGEIFKGIGFGHPVPTCGELIFNTSMSGYQEIITDTSYLGQMVCMTMPHIGIVGVNTNDEEAKKPVAAALIVRSISKSVSNWRSEQDLPSYCLKHKVAGITNLDTRKLTQLLRDAGSVNGCLLHGDDEEKALQLARATKAMVGNPLAAKAGTKKIYSFVPSALKVDDEFVRQPIKKSKEKCLKVALLDCGVKTAILHCLLSRGLAVDVIPNNTPAAKIIKNYQGFIVSNGPGDPDPLINIIEELKLIIKAKLPILGICLGHQLLATALGAQTMKMKFGHHGANHPVLNLKTSKVAITSQNHGFCVADKDIPKSLEVTHISLFDKSIQGFCHKTAPVISFQGHPEASPGPHEMETIFDSFNESVNKHAKKS